jgi:hypothetical protein
VRTGALAIALFALAGCYHRGDRVVGPEPTPFVIQSASSSVVASAASPAADGRDPTEPVGATSAEREREHKTCEVDQDCEGRLHCVAYRGITGRELRQCLFSCLDGCPEDYSCQKHVADGPSNTCERTR